MNSNRTPKGTKPRWEAGRGKLARYVGNSGRLLVKDRMVEIVATASGGRTVIKAIGHRGHPVQFTVLTSNLAEPLPQVFDYA